MTSHSFNHSHSSFWVECHGGVKGELRLDHPVLVQSSDPNEGISEYAAMTLALPLCETLVDLHKGRSVWAFVPLTNSWVRINRVINP